MLQKSPLSTVSVRLMGIPILVRIARTTRNIIGGKINFSKVYGGADETYSETCCFLYLFSVCKVCVCECVCIFMRHHHIHPLSVRSVAMALCFIVFIFLLGTYLLYKAN